MLTRRGMIGLTASCGVLVATPAVTRTRQGFNDADIAWRGFDEGLAAAKELRKPVLMLVHTTWCPHCETYKASFFDPDVVRLMTRFIPVLIDRDVEPELSARFSPDGGYVPRTMVLDTDGELAAGVVGPYREYRYYLPTDRPSALTGFLKAGLIAVDGEGVSPSSVRRRRGAAGRSGG